MAKANNSILGIGSLPGDPYFDAYYDKITSTVSNQIFGTPSYGIPQYKPQSNNFSISAAGKTLVTLSNDGTVQWAEDVSINEAAEAFSKTLSMGAEMKAGITWSVKLKIRDQVFEDIIEIAKTKGSLNADDLTLMLEASKIVEKLKGNE